MPTTSSNCLSLSSSRSSLPSPQPRSSTRLAPLARSAARTAPSRCSLQAQRPLQRLLGPVGGPRRPPRPRPAAPPRRAGRGPAGRGSAGTSGSGGRSPPSPGGRPASLALGQQLLHLVVADEVVLLVVEDRDQDVQVRQQLRERRRPCATVTEKYGLSPHSGNRSSSGWRSPRPRSPAARTRPAGTARRPAPAARRAGPRAGSGVAASSGRSLQRPWRAEPKTCAIATLRNDEAT